jgi:hypothetical protein
MEFNMGKELCEINLPEKLTKIVYLLEENISWNINDNIVIKLNNNKIVKNNINVICINFWYELKQDKFVKLFKLVENIVVPNEYFYKLFPEDYYSKIICYNNFNFLPNSVKQYKISNQIKHVENIFKNKLLLEKYNNKNKPCFFFGLYSDEDFNNVVNHKGDKHIIFGGSDLDINMFHTKIIIPKLKLLVSKNKNIKLYFISKNLQKRALEFKLNGSLVELNLVDNSWSNSLDNLKKSKLIYFYDGFGKTGKLYDIELLKELENRLKKYDLECVYSSKLKLANNEMINVYKKCFVGVRLTKKDGNANTVLELDKLNIPVIFNGNNVNAISWKDINDIEKKILYWKTILNDF